MWQNMVHVARDGGAQLNLGTAGWRAIARHNTPFTMMWHHFPKATNNTMELRAVTKALSFLPP
jgi:ribonuclease HI